MSPVLRALGVLLLSVGLCEGANPVTVKSRSGHVGSAGSTFRFSVGIEQDARNRYFCLEWASEHQSGRSCATLDADKAPRTIWRDVTFRRGGEYQVLAWVLRNDDKIVKSNTEIIIIQSGLGE